MSRNRRNSSKLLARFRSIHMLCVVCILFVVVLFCIIIVNGLVSDVSRDYVRLYTVDSAEKLDLKLNNEISLVKNLSKHSEIIEWFTDEEN